MQQFKNRCNYVHGGQDVLVPAHLNFGKFMFDRIRLKGDEIALHDAGTGQELSYKKLTQNAVNLSSSFTRLGVTKGDVVVLGMECNIDYIPAALGVIFTGATLSPNPLHIGRTVLKYRLSITPPNYLICTERFWNKYSEILIKFKSFKAIITLDNNFHTAVSDKKLLCEDVEVFEPVEVRGQTDVAVLYYSSGTSGMPKGVQLTHLNCILHSLPVNYSDENKSYDTGFHFGEWTSNYTDFKTFMFLASGNKMVYTKSGSTLDWLDMVEKYQVHIVFTTPSTIYQLVNIEDFTKYNLDSLKVIHSRSSPLHADIIQKVKKMLPVDVKVVQAYGMTECGEISSELRGVRGPKPGSVGTPLHGVIMKVVDLLTGENLASNKNGEICIKGSALMKGYIGMEPSSYMDEEDFFKTGDLGYFDEDGYFYIIDRLKEIMIVGGGYMVAPVQLETILQLCPGVKEVAVVGKPDKAVGDLPIAFVVKRIGSEITEKELKDYVAAEVAPHMQLQGVIFISKLPKNARGKILRRRLKELLDEVTN